MDELRIYNTVLSVQQIAGICGCAGVPSPVTSVSVSPTTTGLTASQSQQFTATVTGNANTPVVWSISPANVGSISGSGLYTAPPPSLLRKW